MVKLQKIWYVVFVYISLLSNIFSQPVQVRIWADTNRISIGDWLNVYLEVRYSPDITIQVPHLKDSLYGFELIETSSPDKSSTKQEIIERTIYTLTAFDSGQYVIPPIKVKYLQQGDTLIHQVETSPLLIVVHGIAVDTTKDIRDIKPPISLGISFSELFPYLLGIIILVGIIFISYYFLKKKKIKDIFIPEEPPRPEHEVALEALKALEAERLWQRGKVKEYHSQLTDILRTYIERRFNLRAMEMTTDEILESNVINGLLSTIKEYLKEILIRADLVKFAKFLPLPQENEASMELANKFVLETCRKQVQQVEETISEEVNS